MCDSGIGCREGELQTAQVPSRLLSLSITDWGREIPATETTVRDLGSSRLGTVVHNRNPVCLLQMVKSDLEPCSESHLVANWVCGTYEQVIVFLIAVVSVSLLTAMLSPRLFCLLICRSYEFTSKSATNN
jgi:hypothetical protein